MSTSKDLAVHPRKAEAPPLGLSRRKFLGGVGGVAATAAAMATGALGLEPLVKGGSAAQPDIGPQSGKSRRDACAQYRRDQADFGAHQTVPGHPDNGDDARYA